MTNQKILSLSFVIIRRYAGYLSRTNVIPVLSNNLLKYQVKTSHFHRIMGCRSSKTEIPKHVQSRTDSTATVDDEYVEDVVCCESEIAENEMKVFDLKDAGKVLLVRQKGKIYALGPKCTHYGAPLVNSALGDGRVRCQWHGACFNIETGDIEDFPGLDSLPCHKVTIDNCKVTVRAKKSALQNFKRLKPMSRKLESDKQHFVVIGGGAAGAVCVETLRQENFTGSITLVCKEKYFPYDRVKLSKVADFKVEQNELRTAEFYKEYDINVLLGVAATKVDTEEKHVHLGNGQMLIYDQLFIATGCTANKLNVPGKELRNVLTLRNYEDAHNFFSELSPEKDLVISGSSFIAMEVAAVCVDKVRSVTIISRSKVPFQQILGEEVGYAFMKLFQGKGVIFKTKTNIQQIIDDGTGTVGSVRLDDGSTRKANVLLVGIGSSYATDFLKNSGITLKSEGAIKVDRYLRTNVPGVYAGGDIAYAPVFANSNQEAAIGHYHLAHYHGKIAARNMLGQHEELRTVPFFWTSLLGKSIRYAGNGSYTEIIHSGKIEELQFVAFYINKDEEVVAACSCGMDPIVSQFAELLYQGKKLYKKDINREEPLAWVSMVTPEPVLPLDQRTT